MRTIRLSILALPVVACAMVACTKTQDVTDNTTSARVFHALTPSDADSRTYMDTEHYIYWTADDRISVFQSTVNEQYRFTGKTGMDCGEFEKVGSETPGTHYTRNYAVYPYDSVNASPSEGIFSVMLPPTQNYAENSFGIGANTMTAATKDSEDDVFKFRNACGYLLLKVYGGDVIRSIRFHGNTSEKIAGSATITVAADNVPSVSMADAATTEITLDCGEDGIVTSTSKDSPTQFWIVVPPTTFEHGFIIEITNTDDHITSFTTTKRIIINRNKIVKMSPVKVDTQSEHEFTSFSLSDGYNTYNPIELSDSNIIFVGHNGLNFDNLTVNFTYVGEKVQRDGQDQISGLSTADFSSSTAPIRYSVIARNGTQKDYDVYLFDLPVLYINTPNNQQIVSKTTWIDDAEFKLFNTDGIVELQTSTSIKGRGNTTWGYPKKPFTLKLSQSESLFGIPADKRWNLLANWADRTLMRNAIAFAISEETKDLEWTPKGQYVELILNGKHLGNYYLCEHLKVSKNRIDITELNPLTDVEGDQLTGGYFLEIDNHYDETYQFRSKIRNLPILFKNPDEDVKDVHINYVKDYINNLEECLDDESRLITREYLSYLDVNTFIDFFIVHELTQYGGPSRPYSSHVYKDRLGILKAGPVWDFDRDSFYMPVATTFINNKGLWYNYLFKDNYFVDKLKSKWKETKNNFYNVNTVIDYYSSYIRRSATYNNYVWPTTSRDNGDETLPFADAAARLKNAYNQRLSILDDLIESLPVNYDTKPGTNEDFDDRDDRTGDFNFGF